MPALRHAARLIASLLLAFALTTCSSVKPSPEPRPASASESLEAGSITAVGFADGTIYVARAGDTGCVIEEHPTGGSVRSLAALEVCPTRIVATQDDSLRLMTPSGEMLISANGTVDGSFDAQVSPRNYVSLSDGRLSWHREGEVASAAGEWTGPVVILEKENAVVAIRSVPEGETLVRLEWPEAGEGLAETVLTDPAERIEAIEPDDDQKELALSVLRNGSYDIAITNAEEKITNWVPADPAEELAPRWSPVGYKLSYVISNPGGDILRTVHVPTAAMVLLDFPDSAIIDYTWLPDGERVVVAVSSLLASDHIVETDYMGAVRKVLIAPRYRFDRRVERLPGTPAGSALIMPDSIRYSTSHPLVVWVTGGTAGGAKFNPALVPLLERADVGLLVFNGGADEIDAAFWDAVGEIGWADARHTWLIGPKGFENRPAGFNWIDSSNDVEAVKQVVDEIAEGIEQR